MARRPLLAAAICAALAVLVHTVATHVGAAERLDQHVLTAFMARDGAPGASLAPQIFNLFDPLPFAVMWMALILGAVLAGRRREGFAVALAILGATVTTEMLKRTLSSPHPDLVHSWPSGHTTAVMSLVLGIILISPPRWRWLLAPAGGALTIAVVFSMLVLGSHYPSDVVGGFLVATGFNCLAAAALRAEALPSWRTLAAGPALGVAFLLPAVVTHPQEVVDYTAANTTFVAAALALAAGALVLSGSVLAPRAARPGPPSGLPRGRG